MSGTSMSAPITAQSGADTSSPRERLRLAIQRARELSSAASAAHQAIKGLNEQTPPLTLANGCATTKREDAEDDDELRFAPIELDEGDRSRQLAEQLTHAERARFVALVKHCETVEDNLASAQAHIEGVISELFGETLPRRIEQAKRAHANQAVTQIGRHW
jgi:hypothetical protein